MIPSVAPDQGARKVLEVGRRRGIGFNRPGCRHCCCFGAPLIGASLNFSGPFAHTKQATYIGIGTLWFNEKNVR